jgi:apolipoprotein N-acyltransferase
LALDFIRTSYGGTGFSGPKAIPWFMLSLYLTVVWTLFFLAARWAYRGQPLMLFCPAAWYLFEQLRFASTMAITEMPFPWLQIGICQSQNVCVAQLADLGGVGLVGMVLAFVSGAIVDACWRRPLPLVLALLLVGLTTRYGLWRTNYEARIGPTIALSSHDTVEAMWPVRCDLVLSHEVALRKSIDTSDSLHVSRDLVAFAKLNQTSLAIGVRRFSDDDGTIFNSLAFADDGGIQCYDKQNLVPWSEFTPRLARMSIGGRSRYERGTKMPLFRLGEFTMSPAICFDLCFPNHFRASRPDFFVVASDESSDATGWLADMMLAMSRFRAIENRRSVVRNGTGGFSGIVDGNGTVNPIELGEEETIVIGTVPIDKRRSLYVEWGEWPMIVVCLVYLLLPSLAGASSAGRTRTHTP